MTCRRTAGFPHDGQTRITNNLVAYVLSLAVGESVNVKRLEAAVQVGVPGFTLTTLAVTDDKDVALPAATPLATLYTLEANDVDVTVTS